MDALQGLLGGLGVVYQQLALSIVASIAIEQAPELLQEAVTTVNTVCIPRLRLLHRTQEHLIQTQGVSTILLDNHIRIDDVVHRLRHLFYCPATNVLAIFENELSIVVFWTPSLKCLDIKYIGTNNIDVYVDGGSDVVVLQTEADELTLLGPLLYSIYEVRATLNHTLINQLLEGLILARIARIEEELVPETRVDQVTCSVLSTTYIEVYVAPVFISITTNKRLLVLGVHISQIVG